MRKLVLLILFMACGGANAAGLSADALEPVSLSVKDVEKLNKQNELILPTFNQLDLAQRSKFALYELANHEVITNTYVFKADGKLEYLGSKLAASGQKILFQQDYTSYKNVDVNGKRKKVGILLRLEAELVTKKADLNLNGIFAIGAAASSGSASGRLRLKVYGLSGEAISLAIPAPSDISEQSLLNAFTAIATIKSKIYEDNVFVIPQDIPELPFELGRNQS
ncbi:hypothetical protein N7931_19050 [Catenovulum sp. 2E275]|uniref:hypothetical protein n=1 Tax=Catenovulum sp. 2E275 TaxID=2980497 RepID=UPI0021CEAAF0|nr:hypothetical protein [Catenovulum sp. 2E275]MCU4677711.1 hypothetical protein [Catenovulum sp. 2E275]